MNPDRIYREHRDDALAGQFTAERYSTFVAMPFRNQFSYRQSDVFQSLFCKAAEKATALAKAKRPFAEPRRVDSGPQVASQVTEEIIVRILDSHFFIADLTFENPGVVIETGIALGLKPTKQIILVTQGSPSELHFDINHNTVLRYDTADAVEQLAQALIGASEAFEAECNRYIESIKKRLSPEAILCLRLHGRMLMVDPKTFLHLGAPRPDLVNWYGEDLSKVVYQAAIRELLEQKLIWTEWEEGFEPTMNHPVYMWYGHATALGRLLINISWPEIVRPDVSRAGGTVSASTP